MDDEWHRTKPKSLMVPVYPPKTHTQTHTTQMSEEAFNPRSDNVGFSEEWLSPLHKPILPPSIQRSLSLLTIPTKPFSTIKTTHFSILPPTLALLQDSGGGRFYPRTLFDSRVVSGVAYRNCSHELGPRFELLLNTNERVSCLIRARCSRSFCAT